MSDVLVSQLVRSSKDAFPGVLAAVLVAMASKYLSEHYGGPVMLFALLLGMAFNFLSQEGRCVRGIEISSKKVLRIGVALLGARITADQILSLGGDTLLTVIAGLVLTIVFGWLLGRLAVRDGLFGTLSGGAVAICGASAALAIASVLPKSENTERNTIFTVISVTSLSTLAMIIYPLIVSFFGLNDIEAGIFLGGTIHDVAQVVGAGYSISEEAGDFATLTKLLRVSMLLPVVLCLSLILSLRKNGGRGEGKVPVPVFLFGFIALAGVNSMGWLPETLQGGIVEASRWCLVIAIAALGMKTSLKSMMEVGAWPVTLMVAETLFLAGFVLIAIHYWL